MHVIALSLASSARDGLPIRGSPPGRESGAHAALSCSPARRRRKLIGFLRRERRFDVVSYIELAPYFRTMGKYEAGRPVVATAVGNYTFRFWWRE